MIMPGFMPISSGQDLAVGACSDELHAEASGNPSPVPGGGCKKP